MHGACCIHARRLHACVATCGPAMHACMHGAQRLTCRGSSKAPTRITAMAEVEVEAPSVPLVVVVVVVVLPAATMERRPVARRRSWLLLISRSSIWGGTKGPTESQGR